MTLGERIKKIRKGLDLTQQEFAGRIGSTQNALTGYEKGRRNPSKSVINNICKTFHVNEEWLRDGTGEMFVDQSQDDQIMEFVERTLATRPDSIQRRFAAMLSKLNDSDWEVLERLAYAIVGEREPQEQENTHSGPSSAPYLLDWPAGPQKPVIPNGMVELRVYDQPAAAGLGNDLDDSNYHLKLFPAHLVPSGTDFGVLIDGNSMEPMLHDGYIAFVRATQMVEDGEIGVFFLNGKAYIKGLSNDPILQQTRLESLNPAYKPIVIQEYDNFRPLGLVLGQHKTDD